MIKTNSGTINSMQPSEPWCAPNKQTPLSNKLMDQRHLNEPKIGCDVC